MRIALLLCRVVVGLTFTTYGLVKVLGGQFYHGDWVIDSRTTDPTTLVWCFFGYSPVYGRLIGLAELISGLLLLFPRTKTLGALVLLPVTLNITVMDFCFGFPAVKYFSLLLSALTVALVASDFRKLRPVLWDDARTHLLDHLGQKTAADLSQAPVQGSDGTRSRLTWILLGLLTLALGVPLGNLVALSATPGPENAALAGCVAEGWNESDLSVRGWRRTGATGASVWRPRSISQRAVPISRPCYAFACAGPTAWSPGKRSASSVRSKGARRHWSPQGRPNRSVYLTAGASVLLGLICFTVGDWCSGGR